ncbi:MAG: phospho-N-acetylmuramoyl-pentapeptide-transferase [Clostridia bacterium]|nr:phospho-N-acetylmuramoyl-pentapeptide-transferase [Clostridia bacterium]MBQ2255993.1 phospho-N-acetylmuramoyl-pentapeptide-transferase [Clostridia bacterium]MBQ5792497.1 phospho-N-acetylmuramoyl-pentapeptide-transferase [Clostridia bacterium]
MLLQYFGLHVGTKEAIATEALIAAFAVFMLSTIALYFLIPVLRAKKIGQSIYELGPVWHMNKQGVPTMGGIGFVPPFLLVLAVFSVLFLIKAGAAQSKALIPLALALLLGVANAVIGFIDDYCKLLKKQNQGLTAWQKLLLQLVFAAAYVAMMAITGNLHTDVAIPFTHLTVQLGWLAYPIYIVVIAGFVNATNLTDGIDGLASSITAVVSLFLCVMAVLTEQGSMGVVSAALFGAVCAFLLFNHHPARVFMGDTGSLFIGGVLMGCAFMAHMEVAVIVAGFVYVAEMLSSLLQIVYFKLTHGKRLFKMAPLHHHFEKCKWSEKKIVVVFCLVTALLCAVAALIVLL